MSVTTGRHDGVATVTLDRPGRKNALDPQAFEQLGSELSALAGDPTVRVVVITGAGGDFCAGADLADDGERSHPLVDMEAVNRAAVALHRLAVPTIAKVDGVAVGAGLNLALGCDLVVASDRARFSESSAGAACPSTSAAAGCSSSGWGCTSRRSCASWPRCCPPPARPRWAW